MIVVIDYQSIFVKKNAVLKESDSTGCLNLRSGSDSVDRQIESGHQPLLIAE